MWNNSRQNLSVRLWSLVGNCWPFKHIRNRSHYNLGWHQWSLTSPCLRTPPHNQDFGLWTGRRLDYSFLSKCILPQPPGHHGPEAYTGLNSAFSSSFSHFLLLDLFQMNTTTAGTTSSKRTAARPMLSPSPADVISIGRGICIQSFSFYMLKDKKK